MKKQGSMKADDIRIIIKHEAERHGWAMLWSDMRRGAFLLRSESGLVRLHEGGSSLLKDTPRTIRSCVRATITNGKKILHLSAPGAE